MGWGRYTLYPEFSGDVPHTLGKSHMLGKASQRHGKEEGFLLGQREIISGLMWDERKDVQMNTQAMHGTHQACGS